MIKQIIAIILIAMPAALASQANVTFSLNFNISGAANDNATVDTTRPTGLYTPDALGKFFTCMEDAGISGTPTFGMIFAGQHLNYIQLQNATASYTLSISQSQEDNSFIIPVTTGGCTGIGNKLPLTNLVPFVTTGEAMGAVELSLSYPFIDLVGSFEKSGSLLLVLEKNNTNQIVADVI